MPHLQRLLRLNVRDARRLPAEEAGGEREGWMVMSDVNRGVGGIGSSNEAEAVLSGSSNSEAKFM
jgi:hypothetical protein